MLIFPYSPCPETHIDSGDVESLIRSAQVRMNFGMPVDDVVSDLLDSGATLADAQFAVAAATILETLIVR